MVDSIVRVCIRLFMPRTSQSDPIRIAEVSYPGSAGIIDVTFCPGKKQRNGMSGHWERDKPICSRPLIARSPAGTRHRHKRYAGPAVLHPKRSSIALISRSEEQTSELQSLLRRSYAVFCL